MQNSDWYSPECFWCVGYVCICGSWDLEGDNVNSSHRCVFVKTGTSAPAQCMIGVMPLYGSQPVTEGEKG